MSWKVWIVASGIAKRARVTNRKRVDCRLVISACKSDPMMKSYISRALLVSRLQVERGEGREPVEMHVEEIESDRIFDVGGVEDAELAVERLSRSEEFEAREGFDELPLAVEDDEGAFAVCGALQILGNEIEQGGGFARAGACDDPVVRSAGLRRDIDGKRGREEALERRAGEKRRWVVEVMRFSEFRRLGLLAARDP
jgi:hypothetical protein